MKTNLNLVLAFWGSVICGQAQAQATYYFSNYPTIHSPGIDAPVYDWTGNLLSGSAWRAELYGGATPDSLSPVVSFYSESRAVVPLAAPGYFIANKADLSVFDVPVFGWAWLQVRVWDATLGTTYEEALARGLGGYGESALFYAQGGNPLVSPPTLPGPLYGLQSFSLRAVVPEPATGALLALGGLGLWWATRRRQGGQP